ncbi:uncharacterized protein METZ01_LOCUS196934 [marine metagenome]|uniref:Uncharacterized protein n=1 Tax=marine metagenome TaxID=408172 RepID=A0A382E048_9ZZZZ
MPLEMLLQSSGNLENQMILTAVTGQLHRAGIFLAIQLNRIARLRLPIPNFQSNCE